MPETALVFDPLLWNNKDQGDNSQFWKEAEILERYQKGGDRLVNVRFLHDGRLSYGHFEAGIRPLSAKKASS